MPPTSSLPQAIQSLYDDSRALWLPHRVAEYTTPGSAVPFLRDHVAPSVPCVWRGAASHWPAVGLWGGDDFAHLRRTVGHKEVDVALTPDGRADAVVQALDARGRPFRAFAAPQVERQRVSELLSSLSAGPGAGDEADGAVPYYSAQDSSLTRELGEVACDVDAGTVRFAETAFGGAASATNVWIGDGRSVTTTHADPFENVYAVVSGCKTFELRPPCDAAWLPKPRLRNVRWGREGGRWRTREMEGWTEWVDEEMIDERWGKGVEVEVRAGDLLYLPALWCKLRQKGSGRRGRGCEVLTSVCGAVLRLCDSSSRAANRGDDGRELVVRDVVRAGVDPSGAVRKAAAVCGGGGRCKRLRRRKRRRRRGK